MKTITLILTIITLGFAGMGYNYIDSDIQTDRENNRIYIGINGTRIEGTFSKTEKIGYNIVDYLLYEPATKTEKRIMPKNKKSISLLLFETAYDDSAKAIRFNSHNNSDYSYSIAQIMNNQQIEKRPVRDKLLFVISDREAETKEFWQCSKTGENLKKIYTISSGKNHSWHIDVLNSVIRVIIKTPNSIEIDEIEW